MANIIAIVGRPNVGKSTLYNRLVGERDAIIDNVSGVTRDRIYGSSFWNGKYFTVIDTGGFVKDSNDIFEREIRSQVQVAIQEADSIIFMVDVTTGITDLDEEVANMLRRIEKDVFLVVNKVDNHSRELAANEFWSLGFESTYFLSSITGSGTGELLDDISENLELQEEDDIDLPKYAIIGRPNVGKSSLTNAFLDEKRNIVTDIAGTTRDSIHSKYQKFGKEFILIDTAGIRKKGKVTEDLEFYSVMRAVRAVEDADVCLLLVDASIGFESQDMNILHLAIKRHKGMVILLNKWDLVKKDTNTALELENRIREKLAPFRDLPIITISALTKQRVYKALEVAESVFENRSRKIKTAELNKFLQNLLEQNPPPAHRGKFIKINYVTQLPVAYPAFAFFCNHPRYIIGSYQQFVENQLRKSFNFTGVPISLYFRKK